MNEPQAPFQYFRQNPGTWAPAGCRRSCLHGPDGHVLASTARCRNRRRRSRPISRRWVPHQRRQADRQFPRTLRPRRCIAALQRASGATVARARRRACAAPGTLAATIRCSRPRCRCTSRKWPRSAKSRRPDAEVGSVAVTAHATPATRPAPLPGVGLPARQASAARWSTPTA